MAEPETLAGGGGGEGPPACGSYCQSVEGPGPVEKLSREPAKAGGEVAWLSWYVHLKLERE